MKRLLILPVVALLCMGAGQCSDGAPDNRAKQADAARAAAASITYTDNAEIENIKRRLEITSKPGALGYIILMNEAGQPILYEGVRGKVTSGGKRLTQPDRSDSWGAGTNNVVRQAPSDEGTYGNAGEYIFYWNMDGAYRQWAGKYLYSDQPLRLRIEPLVVSVKP